MSRCLLYSCMLYQWCYTVNKCSKVRTGSTLSYLYTPACTTLSLIKSEPANQAQHKWLVLPQCTWGQWNTFSLCHTFGAQCGAWWKTLGNRGEPFLPWTLTVDELPTTTNINHYLCKGDVNPHPQLEMSLLVWWPSCVKGLQALCELWTFNILLK